MSKTVSRDAIPTELILEPCDIQIKHRGHALYMTSYAGYSFPETLGFV